MTYIQKDIFTQERKKKTKYSLQGALHIHVFDIIKLINVHEMSKINEEHRKRPQQQQQQPAGNFNLHLSFGFDIKLENN